MGKQGERTQEKWILCAYRIIYTGNAIFLCVLCECTHYS